MQHLYINSLSNARRENEVTQWRESLKENIRCKKAIEKALSDGFDGMHLCGGIVERLVDDYGTDRLTWVLANTVKEHSDDGRFRPENKGWANEICVPKDCHNYEFAVNSHPEIVNGLITDYRRYLVNVLHQYGVSDCLPESTLIYLANALGVTPDELLCDYVEAETATVPNNIAKKMEKLNPKQRRHVEEMVDCMIAYMLEGK